MQKGLKALGGKKKVKAYIPEALEYFRKNLELIRHPNSQVESASRLQINISGLQSAIQALPKEERESAEKFWGLTGGPNHSKKMLNSNTKDVAFYEMRNKAVISLRKLLTLDYIIMYDNNIKAIINAISRKVNKTDITISDIEIAKLLMAFTLYMDNGPKMTFEDDPMSIDTSLNGSFLFDEYEVVFQLSEEIQEFPDGSINLKLLTSFFEMADFQKMLTMKKSTGIEISKFFEKLQVIKKGQGIQNINDFTPRDVETVKTVNRIREFKEKMFPYGEWKVSTELILGDREKKFNLEGFKDALDKKRGKSWVEKIEGFKTTQTKQIRTSEGIRILYVYQIGGLEFTDPQEIDFLYLYGDLA